MQRHRADRRGAPCRVTILARAEGNRRNQPVTALRDRPHETWIPDGVAEDPSQFRDGARQDVVADERVGPDRPHQVFFGHNPTGMRGKAYEHRMTLGSRRVVPAGPVTLLSDGST